MSLELEHCMVLTQGEGEPQIEDYSSLPPEIILYQTKWMLLSLLTWSSFIGQFVYPEEWRRCGNGGGKGVIVILARCKFHLDNVKI